MAVLAVSHAEHFSGVVCRVSPPRTWSVGGFGGGARSMLATGRNAWPVGSRSAWMQVRKGTLYVYVHLLPNSFSFLFFYCLKTLFVPSPFLFHFCLMTIVFTFLQGLILILFWSYSDPILILFLFIFNSENVQLFREWGSVMCCQIWRRPNIIRKYKWYWKYIKNFGRVRKTHTYTS